MLKAVLTSLASVLVLALSATTAFADSAFNANPSEGVVIIRTDKAGNKAIMSFNQAITSEKQAKELAKNGRFEAVSSNQVTSSPISELDQTKGISSWYVAVFPQTPSFSFNACYGYGGFCYPPVYGWNWGSYSYSYYTGFPTYFGWPGYTGWNGWTSWSPWRVWGGGWNNWGGFHHHWR